MVDLLHLQYQGNQNRTTTTHPVLSIIYTIRKLKRKITYKKKKKILLLFVWFLILECFLLENKMLNTIEVGTFVSSAGVFCLETTEYD